MVHEFLRLCLDEFKAAFGEVGVKTLGDYISVAETEDCNFSCEVNAERGQPLGRCRDRCTATAEPARGWHLTLGDGLPNDVACY